MEKVSLYIPCYNAGRYIDKCLGGALRQTYSLHEVIVVDDGSTDDTAERASAHRVKLIRHETNKGLASARNTAILASSGDFIASLDADCLASATWLEDLMRRFTGPDIAGVGGKLVERYQGSLADRWRAVYMRQHWGDDGAMEPRFLFGSNNVFRKSAIIEAGMYDISCRTNGEDFDMSMRLKARGYRFAYQPQAVVEHLRKDSVRSVLDTHWRWTFIGTTGTRRVPGTIYSLFCKTYDNLVYLFRDMIAGDIKNGRAGFIPLDLLSWLHHLYRDAGYYLSSKRRPG